MNQQYLKALRYVVTSGKANVVDLQKELKTGFYDAGMILYQMELDGYVSAIPGKGIPRKVLLSEEELSLLSEYEAQPLREDEPADTVVPEETPMDEAEPEQTEEPADTVVPEETEIPMDEAEPEETEESEQTEVPEETEEPMDEAEPEETAEPADTVVPEQTEGEIDGLEEIARQNKEEMAHNVDPVFLKILRHCVETGDARVSSIQGKCFVGFRVAVSALDWMEEMGYLKADGTNRTVILTKREFEEIYGK